MVTHEKMKHKYTNISLEKKLPFETMSVKTKFNPLTAKAHSAGFGD